MSVEHGTHVPNKSSNCCTYGRNVTCSRYSAYLVVSRSRCCVATARLNHCGASLGRDTSALPRHWVSSSNVEQGQRTRSFRPTVRYFGSKNVRIFLHGAHTGKLRLARPERIPLEVQTPTINCQRKKQGAQLLNHELRSRLPGESRIRLRIQRVSGWNWNAYLAWAMRHSSDAGRETSRCERKVGNEKSNVAEADGQAVWL